MILVRNNRIVRVHAKVNGPDDLRSDPLIVMRHALADRWHAKYRKEMFKQLKAQVLEVAKLVAGGSTEPTTDSMEVRWTESLLRVKRKLVPAMVRSGMELTDAVQFGKSMNYFPGVLGPDINPFAGKIEPVGLEAIGYDQDDIFLHQAQTQNVEAYLQATSKKETSTSRKKLDKLYKDANSYWDPVLERGLTPTQMAKQILAQGLADSVTRSTLMSRTTTMWAYNEGATQSYINAGVPAMSWVTSNDDVLCEFCVQMDGQMIRTGDPFLPAGMEFPGLEGGTLNIPEEWSVGHPPLHPMCRCTVYPIVVETDVLVVRTAADQLREDYTKKIADGTMEEARARRAQLLRSRRKKRPKPPRKKAPKKEPSPFPETKKTEKTLEKKKPVPRKKKPVSKKPEVVEFTPASTKKEATRWAEDNIIDLNSVRATIGDPVTGYNKLQMKSANVINEELTTLTRKYGIKLDGIKARALGHAEADVFAGMTRGRVLDVNTKYWNRLDAFGKHITRLNAEGWHASRTAQDILAHEYGHGIIGTNSARRKLIKEAFEIHKANLVKSISRYGSTTYEEMWAEIFLKFDRGRKLPKWADDLVRKVLGKPAKKVRKVRVRKPKRELARAPKKFEAAKTEKEVDRRLKEFAKKIDLRGVTLKQKNRMLQGLESTLGRFGKGIKLESFSVADIGRSFGKYTYFGKSGAVTRDLIRLQQQHVSALKHSFRDAQKLYLDNVSKGIKTVENAFEKGTIKVGAEKKAKLRLKQWRTIKRSNVSTDADFDPVLASTAHEGWHSIYRRNNLHSRWRKALKNNKQWGKTVEKFAISDYAPSRPSETFAEIGAALEVGLKIAAPLKRAFLQIIRSL